MHRITLSKLLFAGVFSAMACAQAQQPGSTQPQTAAESPDAAFVSQAAMGGLAEVQLSTLAAQSASAPAVRKFAQQMVHDHTANNKELATIAAHENIQVPMQMDAKHAALRDELASQHGAQFDRTYVDAMREDHQKMVDLLKSSAATVSTDELRTFIKKTLPVVEGHLSMAQGLKVQ
jgi:putative membrane protein